MSDDTTFGELAERIAKLEEQEKAPSAPTGPAPAEPALQQHDEGQEFLEQVQAAQGHVTKLDGWWW